MSDRLPIPWTVHSNADAYWVQDARGHKFAFIYYRTEPLVGTSGSVALSQDLARRIATNVAKLPMLLGPRS